MSVLQQHGRILWHFFDEFDFFHIRFFSVPSHMIFYHLSETDKRIITVSIMIKNTIRVKTELKCINI